MMGMMGGGGREGGGGGNSIPGFNQEDMARMVNDFLAFLLAFLLICSV